jgi:hypothetical protein
MAAFPSYAVLLGQNYTETPDSAVQRTNMENGPPKQLKFKSRVIVTIAAVYALKSMTDYTNFVDWFRNTINFGADWFDWTDPKTGSTVTARIVNGQYSAQAVNPDGSYWQLTMSIEYWSS